MNAEVREERCDPGKDEPISNHFLRKLGAVIKNKSQEHRMLKSKYH